MVDIPNYFVNQYRLNIHDIFQAKYDQKQEEKKESILPYTNQPSWQDRTNHMYFKPNGIQNEGYSLLTNGHANGSAVNYANNNSYNYIPQKTKGNLLFV